jgi:hypothetical protein
MYQQLPFEGPLKFTQIGIFGLKTNHLATLQNGWQAFLRWRVISGHWLQKFVKNVWRKYWTIWKHIKGAQKWVNYQIFDVKMYKRTRRGLTLVQIKREKRWKILPSLLLVGVIAKKTFSSKNKWKRKRSRGRSKARATLEKTWFFDDRVWMYTCVRFIS